MNNHKLYRGIFNGLILSLILWAVLIYLITKMTFIETTHAANRLKTRGISSPNGQRLVSVGRGTRRRIRQTCPDMGCDLDEYTYFRNKQKHIFVTKQISKDVYLLITAFKI